MFSVYSFIFALEILTAAFSTALGFTFWIKGRFSRFATSAFLVAAVPLIGVYPLLARLFFGGAYTIIPGYDYTIKDPHSYLIFQFLNLALFGTIYITTLVGVLKRRVTAVKVRAHATNEAISRDQAFAIVACVGCISGVFLFIYSTGMPIGELMVAGRFDWYSSNRYSGGLAVFSSYLISLNALCVFLCLKFRLRWLLCSVVVAMVFYLLISKDRKLFLFFVSGWLFYLYFSGGGRINVRFGRSLLMLGLALVMGFWQVFRDPFYLLILGVLTIDDFVVRSVEMSSTLLARGDITYFYNAAVTAIDLHINKDYSIPLGLLRRQLFLFLPVDYSLGLKIVDISSLFSDYIDAGDASRGGNMPPGFYGLLIVSFGVVASSIFLVFFAIMLACLDGFIRKRTDVGVILGSFLMASSVYLLRGDDSTATYYPLFAVIVYFLYSILVGLLKNKAGQSCG